MFATPKPGRLLIRSNVETAAGCALMCRAHLQAKMIVKNSSGKIVDNSKEFLSSAFDLLFKLLLPKRLKSTKIVSDPCFTFETIVFRIKRANQKEPVGNRLFLLLISC
jgi:hypothetical protein